MAALNINAPSGPALDNAINKAMSEQSSALSADEPTVEVEDGGAVETPVETEGDEDTSEADEQAEEEEAAAEEEDPGELNNARQLYNALKNPATAKQVIQLLAQQAGLLETQKDVSTAKSAVLETLENALGAEFGFLSAKLGPAIESILERERQAFKQDLQRETNTRMQTQMQLDLNATLSKLAKETKGESKKLEARMTALMDEIRPGPKISVENYIRSLYKVASSEQSEKAVKRTVAAKINSNANNLAARLNSQGVKSGSPDPPAKSRMNLDQAIQYAMQNQKG